MQTRPLFTPCDRKRKQLGVSHAMDSAHTELLQHVQADVVIMELAESYDEITSSMAFEALHDLNDTPGAFSSVLASHRLSRAILLLRPARVSGPCRADTLPPIDRWTAADDAGASAEFARRNIVER